MAYEGISPAAYIPWTKRIARFRDTIDLHSNEPFFKTVVEQRKIAKDEANGDHVLKGLERGLKEFAAGGAYGIFAEVIVTPGKADASEIPCEVYSDVHYQPAKLHDKRRGRLAIPSSRLS